MTTAAILKERTVKDLGQLAKQYGVSGWHAMRKDELVRALVRACKAEAARSARKTKATPAKGGRKESPARRSGNAKAMSASAKGSAAPAKKTPAKGSDVGAKRATAKGARKTPAERSAKATGSVSTSKAPASKTPVPKAKSARVVRRIQQANAERERRKDLSLASYVPKVPRRNGSSNATGKAANGKASKNGANGRPDKDRLVLLVRDPFWLHACWDVTRQSVQRARAAMAEHWHTARPVLRLLEVDSGATTSSAERVVRDIEVHGGVKNWYVDVMDPPKSYRVDLGYLASSGRFYTLARSNAVKTPQPGASDAIDENWSDVAANYEKIYAQSGGNTEETAGGELQELFEERLRRPMGSPVVTGYGVGAERTLHRHRNFEFEVDAEMIIYGSSKPDAHVTLGGEPVKLRPDGTFTVRLSMPDRRQVLPVVAASADGVEQRTIVLAVERNTKIMEPMIREANE